MKGILLTFELVGKEGKEETQCYANIDEMSAMKQPFNAIENKF